MAVQGARCRREVERHLGLEPDRAEGVEQLLSQVEIVLDEEGKPTSREGGRGPVYERRPAGARPGTRSVPPRTIGGPTARCIVARTADSARRSAARDP